MHDAVVRNLALEQAIIASPDDDGPRIVYGDWLQEQGDPRGELVAVQRAGIAAREDELFAQHGRAWLGPLTNEHVTWRLGFIDVIDRVELAQLDAVARLESARFVRALTVVIAGDPPVRIPTFSFVHVIGMIFEAPRVDAMPVLLDDKRWPRATTLRIHGVTSAFARELVESIVITDLFDELRDVVLVGFDEASYETFEWFLLKRHVNIARE